VLPHLVQMREKFPKDKVVIIGLSDEPQAKVDPYVKSSGMNYAVGYGSTSMRDYGVNGIPHAYIIGPDGLIKWEGYPTGKEVESTIESLMAQVKGGGGASVGGNKALGDAVTAALKTDGIPSDLKISYTRTDPVKKTVREIKVDGSLKFELKEDGKDEVKKGKVEDKELRDLLKAVEDTEFATKEFKEPPKPNVTIAVTLGKEGREIHFDLTKGYGNFGRVNKLLEDLHAKYCKK
jgi:hypothetical protein